MKIHENIVREEYNPRGGGCELDLSAYGYDDEFLSAYQNYLGGGMLGSIGNSCTVTNWKQDEALVTLADTLRAYYLDEMYARGYIDEYNELPEGRPTGYPGL